MTPDFDVIDLQRMRYADAYALQVEHLEQVLAERESPTSDLNHVGRVLLVEHDPPVITVTRRPEASSHLLASRAHLLAHGIEVQETDRGGDITYHGPGQLVVYPILDLNRLKLRLHDYMRLLESTVITVCEQFGVSAERDACATGVWVPQRTSDATSSSTISRHTESSSTPTIALTAPACHASSVATAKICAMGVRVRRWISMHGLALNVTTNLDHFNLIVPCGLAGRPVTGLARELGPAAPDMNTVKAAMIASLRARLREHAERRTPNT